MMDDRIPKSIVAVVFFERGSQGFEEPFDAHKSVEEWIEYFKKETKRMNKSDYPIVFYIQKTFQDKDGFDLVDKKGDRITQTIYLNKDILSNLARA